MNHLFLLAWVALAAPAPTGRVYFQPFTLAGGVTTDEADSLLGVLAREASDRGAEVVTYKEVEGAVEQQQLHSTLPDADPSKLVDPGRLANAQELVTGALQRTGDDVILTVTRTRVSDGQVIARGSVRAVAKKGVEPLLFHVARLATEVFGPARRAAATRPRIVVLPLGTGAGVDKALGEAATITLAARIARRADMDLVTLQEIEALVNPEQVERARGCDGEQCAAEVASALNAREIVVGNVGRVGTSLLVTAARIRTSDAQVLSRASLRLTNATDADALDGMATLATQLVPESAMDKAPVAAPDRGTRATPILPRILGAAALGAGSVGLLLGALALAGAALNAAVVVVDVASSGRPGRRGVTPPVAMAANAAWVVMVGSGVGAAVMLALTGALIVGAVVL